jgi:hypothetical protein
MAVKEELLERMGSRAKEAKEVKAGKATNGQYCYGRT